jgi:hypothetical protein
MPLSVSGSFAETPINNKLGDMLREQRLEDVVAGGRITLKEFLKK